jgi:hypothetical protein
MCDYSLHHVATRPARIEDKLVATKFPKSITRGFAAAGEPHVAVCLLPGTEVAFDENVECEPSFGTGILPNKKIGQRLARFRQINMDNPVTHHDALEFPDGQVVLVTRLVIFASCRESSGECLDDEMATLLASRDNIRQMTPCGGLLRRTTIPAFHRKRSSFDVCARVSVRPCCNCRSPHILRPRKRR